MAIDDPKKSKNELDLLAGMTLFEGTGCWQLVDVRLSKHGSPSPYAGSLMASDLQASFMPSNEDEATLVKSLLREFSVDDEGAIRWCSFNGIVRGSPEVNGYAPAFKKYDQAGYFSQADGLKKIYEMKEFWDNFDGDPKTAKIENPNLQPTETEVYFAVTTRKIELQRLEKNQRIENLSSLEKMAGAAYSFWMEATAAINNLEGRIDNVNWSQVEHNTIHKSIAEHGQPASEVLDVILKFSPGAVSERHQDEVRAYVAKLTPELELQYSHRDIDVSSELNR